MCSDDDDDEPEAIKEVCHLGIPPPPPVAMVTNAPLGIAGELLLLLLFCCCFVVIIIVIVPAEATAAPPAAMEERNCIPDLLSPIRSSSLSRATETTCYSEMPQLPPRPKYTGGSRGRKKHVTWDIGNNNNNRQTDKQTDINNKQNKQTHKQTHTDKQTALLCHMEL